MPTTLTSLLLFIVLLVPGITYVAVRERDTPNRSRSAFRETATVASASIVSNSIALGLLAVVRVIFPQATPDPAVWIIRGSRYLADNLALIAGWSAAMVISATTFAWLAARLADNVHKPHPSTMSSWWMIFDHWKLGRSIRVGCVLDDGTYLEGALGSYNNASDDTLDRDVLLVGPIKYRPAGSAETEPYHCSVVCISAHRIASLFVTYSGPATSPEPEEVEEAETSAGS